VPELTIHHPGERPPIVIEPADRWRDWMHATSNRVANRCLPLLVANQAGWVMRNPAAFEVTWDGGDGRDALTVVYDGEDVPGEHKIATSHFGYGIVSFAFRCWFTTSEGYNLLARGPANSPKDGIGALEGMVETDWALVPFTMSWKLTRPGSVRFEEGEPFCQLVPQRRGELESFELASNNLHEDRESAGKVQAWSATRRLYRIGKGLMAANGDEKYTRKWMDDYFRGRTPTGETGDEHQTTLRLRGLD
jgi:Family of unknown function (DUF6065)